MTFGRDDSGEVCGRRSACGRLSAAAALAAALWASPAWALSEIQREELPPPLTSPAPEDGAAPEEGGEEPRILAPDAPSVPGSEASPDAAAEPGDGSAEEADETGILDNGPLPEISYDLSMLPEPVRRMHGLLVEAAKSGDIEGLRALISGGEEPTQLSLGEVEGDVIDYLRKSSGDGEGYELLAILEEVLSAGYAHLHPGKPEEVYVWPYFFAVPLDRLDARQRVELFKLVTSGDLEEMQNFGAYNFYRVGIDPEGRWAFFVAGD
ncbi:MAG TPA: hypothetical protein VGN97_23735 [Mesorhizobium sp.]|jgi:hypothetical protein|nr:hypothetical protein [Mesorhizobium sp.]